MPISTENKALEALRNLIEYVESTNGHNGDHAAECTCAMCAACVVSAASDDDNSPMYSEGDILARRAPSGVVISGRG